MTPRTVSVVESRWTTVALSQGEQHEIERAGRALAVGTNRFGQASGSSTASLIQVRRFDEQTAEVRVADAVGLVACSTLQLLVTPKVPAPHLLFLLREAAVVPRFDRTPGWTSTSEDLASLVCHWFVTCAEQVLEEGLARDYLPLREQLSVVRGRLDVLETTRLFYRGRPAVVSEFEDYDFDTPINRLLLHAARIVASGPTLSPMLRKRALRVSKRFDGVGVLRHSDLSAHVERRTSYYADALLLAKQVVDATGRTFLTGTNPGWTFLISTPKPVEMAIRALAQAAVDEEGAVKKGQLRLGGGTLTVSPDLVFSVGGQQWVGDVKYKAAGEEWARDDLYELVAFATAYRAPHGCLVSFAPDGAGRLAPVTFGDVTISDIRWDARPTTSPDDASRDVREQLQAWFAFAAQAPAFKLS